MIPRSDFCPARGNDARVRAPRSAATHRTYGRFGGRAFVPCRTVSDGELVSLAESVDDVELHTASSSPQIRKAELTLLRETVRALPWVDQAALPHELRRDLCARIRDTRARFRIRNGQHLLVGVAVRPGADGDERVLILVLTSTHVLTCDWQLAA